MNSKLIKKRDSYIVILAIIVVAFLYKCPYDYLFGISCPGCGMTRACFALLKLDFKLALYYHPLCVLMPILAIGFLLDKFNFIKIEEKYKKLILAIICLLFIFVYILRMFHENDVVRFHPEDALIIRIWNQITEFIKNATL